MEKHLDELAVNTIRLLAADAVEKANSGHPGLPLGAANMAYILWKDFLQGSATEPNWRNRDRFVLSAGHGSMLVYALLHLFGYEVNLEDLKQFRQLGSITAGHPEYGVAPGVEVTTGPLGQGIANAVGMAMAERKLASEFNQPHYDIFDHYTYVICGDGDLMEGVSMEAVSLAGHLGLNKLIVLYDDNGITIDGSTQLAFTEDVGQRFNASGWQVIEGIEGKDSEAIRGAIEKARASSQKPTLIMVKNIIGYGSPNKAGKSSAHGSPLGEAELKETKRFFGFDPEASFVVPDEVSQHLKGIIDKRELSRFKWEEQLENYFEAYPEMKRKYEQWFEYGVEESLLEDPRLWEQMNVKDATRNSGGKWLNFAAQTVSNLFGGSADLNSSTKTYLKGKGDFSKENFGGSNIFFGIREHAMGAILNGIALHGGLRAYGSTFLVFSDYMKPSIRLSALMKLPVVYIFTHDSVAVGEDGPTHQPIEHLNMLRSIPHLNVYRPADGRETAYCYYEAFKRTDGPSALILTRQDLGLIETSGKGVQKGAYIVRQEAKERPDLILIATGSEVNLSLEVSEWLFKLGIDTRVISMPCLEVFEQQSTAYREALIPKDVKKRISIEMGITSGWHRYIGDEGLAVGIDTFGESGPGELVMAHFGFEKQRLIEKILAYYQGK